LANREAGLKEAVRALLEEDLDIIPQSDHTDLIGDGHLDSLAFVELVFQLEVRFGVVVLPEHMEFDNFRTVEQIVAFVAAQGGGPSA